MPVTIRIGSESDAEALARFAAEIFRETFGPDNRPEDMDAYVAGAFTLEGQLATLRDASAVVLIAEDDAGIAGYAQLERTAVPREVGDAPAVEIERFYVARRWQGRGLARDLMDAAIATAATRGARVVWLGVWERNARAISFYARLGFRRVGSQPFMLGSDVQTDLVMARPVAPVD